MNFDELTAHTYKFTNLNVRVTFAQIEAVWWQYLLDANQNVVYGKESFQVRPVPIQEDVLVIGGSETGPLTGLS